MVRPRQIYSDERVEFPVPPLMDSNCHVMKLMFCRIYNLILMVFLPPPLSSFSPISFLLSFLLLLYHKRNRDNMWGVINFLSPCCFVLFFLSPFFSTHLLSEVEWARQHLARPIKTPVKVRVNVTAFNSQHSTHRSMNGLISISTQALGWPCCFMASSDYQRHTEGQWKCSLNNHWPKCAHVSHSNTLWKGLSVV